MKFCDETCEYCNPEKNYCYKFNKPILPYNRCLGEMKYKAVCWSPHIADDKCEYRNGELCTLKGECTWKNLIPIPNEAKDDGQLVNLIYWLVSRYNHDDQRTKNPAKNGNRNELFYYTMPIQQKRAMPLYIHL